MKPQAVDKKSPLKAAPLRNPGQTLDEHIEQVIVEHFLVYFMAAIFLVVMTALEWWKWYTQSPPRPVPVTIAAVAFMLLVAYKFRVTRRKLRQLRLARDGEKAVGQYLERLREHGYQVLHDLVGEGFNIDHVLVGPAGVFTIETKTISKPKRGPAEIAYDGEQVTVGGFTPDRNPIIQGKAQARWLRELLRETTGQDYPVRAFVVYPGWFVNGPLPSSPSDVGVVNPKAIPALLEKASKVLDTPAIKLVSYHLSRYARVMASAKVG